MKPIDNLVEIENWLNGLGESWNLFGHVDKGKHLVKKAKESIELIEMDEDEDSLWMDDDDELDYTDFDCTCGAWIWSEKVDRPIHVADCICGCSAPWG